MFRRKLHIRCTKFFDSHPAPSQMDLQMLEVHRRIHSRNEFRLFSLSPLPLLSLSVIHALQAA
jgi:hypothetical protein